jgi:hypothetical protein
MFQKVVGSTRIGSLNVGVSSIGNASCNNDSAGWLLELFKAIELMDTAG